YTHYLCLVSFLPCEYTHYLCLVSFPPCEYTHYLCLVSFPPCEYTHYLCLVSFPPCEYTHYLCLVSFPPCEYTHYLCLVSFPPWVRGEVSLLSLCEGVRVEGFVVCQRGPSILDLGLITGADLQSTAAFFSLGAGGYMAGCLLTGLTFDRFCKQMFLFWALVGLCATTATLPWCVPYSALGTFYFTGFVFVGSLETGSYAVVARVWGRQGVNVLKVLQLAYIIGGIISPVITSTFLVHRPITYVVINSHVSINRSRIADRFPNTSHPLVTTQPVVSTRDTDTARTYVGDFQGHSHRTSNDTSEFSESTNNHKAVTITDLSIERVQSSQDTTTQLQSVYAISAAVCLLASAPFLVSYIRTSRTDLKQQMGMPSNSNCERNTERYTTSIHRRWVVLVVVVYFFLITSVEESFHQFLFTVMVTRSRWTSLWASLLTAWFWCGVGVVRIMALLLPQWVSDETFLVSSCASLVCSLAGLHFSMTYTLDSGVWVCVLLIGISTSLVTPLTFSWLHTALMQASSAASVSAVVMVASSMAGVLSPLILSHVMQRHSLKWFAYLLLLESGVSLLLLFLMILVSRTLLISWQGVDTDVTMDKTDDTTSVDN
ncbi:hypothetical protein BaRGS_00039321, partial [Batillaria attramentaria]